MNVSSLKRNVYQCALAALLTLAGAGSAMANVPVSNAPLFLPTPVDPNVMFIIDDSGSMHWEVTPDEYLGTAYYVFPRAAGNYGGGDYDNVVVSFRDAAPALAAEQAYVAAMRSSEVNKSYYNPAITYRPWVRADGTLFPNSNATSARHHPIRNTGTRNLTANETANVAWRRCTAGATGVSGCATNNESRTFYPAVYFQYNGGNRFARASYTKVEIRSTTSTYSGGGRENRSDCTGGVCTYAQEIQNFANWYTYYRSRMLASQAAIGRAFVNQSDRMRVGFGSLNAANSDVDGVNSRAIIRGVRKFEGVNRQNFYQSLYEGVWPPSNTPLRRALDDAGQYFSRDDNAGPWGGTPGTNDTSPHIECRQSYTILMTDGYWTNDAASQAPTAEARGNVDGTGGPTITGPAGQTYTYQAVTPFTDGHVNTLADVAMYYWKRDLRPDVENRVPSSPLNPAFWQHMVTFGVGLGVSGSVDPELAFQAIGAVPPVNITWPNPTASNPARLDDLLHAGVNSRGGFFSAADPETFASELSGVLQTIVARTLQSGGASASAARRDGDFLAFVPDFDTSDWTGDVKAYRLLPDGTLGSLAWSAADRLTAGVPVTLAARQVFASVPTAGNYQLVPLSSAVAGLGLTAADFAQYGPGITAVDVVNYIRGDHSREVRNGGTLRDRARRVGDIINSQPEVLSNASFGYEFLPDDAGGGTGPGSYREFVNFKKTRNPVLFVATNNGMLHGFDARPTGGGEIFAIIPNSALPFVKELPKQDYERRFLLDGAPVQGDVRLGGQWRTILLAPAGLGGGSILALDVTNPQASFGSGNMLWEFQHPGLGLTISKPSAVRLRGGRWVALFGNGLNSPGGGGVSAHKASLYAVDVSDAANFQRVQAGEAGTSADPNGMTAVAGVDSDGDGGVDVIYGADYHGQLWRFLVDESGVIGAPSLMFSATDSAGARQLVTGELDVGRHHLGGQIVFFGTGRFLAEGDNQVGGATQVQSFYAIWDNGSDEITRSDLQQQSILSTVPVAGGSGRRISNNEVDWTSQAGWYLDFRIGATDSRGERFIGQPLVYEGLVQFVTYEPLGNPCISGGVNRLYLLNAISGGRALNLGADCPDCGSVDVREGAPVLITDNVIKPPARVCRPGIDPDCDPEYGDGTAAPCDPADPACVLLPVRGEQCVLEIGPLLPEGVRTIVRVPCGRTGWRRIE